MSSGSAGSKEVDLRELFVYKVFEMIGVAPEVHFLFGEEGVTDCYIVTKDAGFDELAQEQKKFLTYVRLKETEEAQLSCMRISDISRAWAGNQDKTFKTADELEEGLCPIGLNIIKGLSKADILSRIFVLTDLTTNNSGNIGFVSGDNLSKFEVIDFSILDMGAYKLPEMFDGFLAGNGRHRYCCSADEQIRYVLYVRHQAKRVHTAKAVMNELTTREITPRSRPLNSETLGVASEYIKGMVKRSPSFLNLSDAMRNLDEYAEGVRFNLENFEDSFLHLYTDDYIQRILEYFLPVQNGFTVIPPTAAIFGDAALLGRVTRNAMQAALAGNIVVMPIHIHGNHWVGAVFRHQTNGTIQVIYTDPQGGSLQDERNVEAFTGVIRDVANAVTHGAPDIIDLQLRQQGNGIDCGPFTVDNLIRIARNVAELNGLGRDEIITRARLQRPIDGSATAIRIEHNAIFSAPLPSMSSSNAHSIINNTMQAQPMLAGTEFTQLPRGLPLLSSS